MNQRTILLSILLIAILVTAGLNPVLGKQYSKRIIEVNALGLVYIYDEVPSTGDKTVIQFPKNLVKNLVNYASTDDPEPELEVGNSTFSIIIDSKPGQTVHLVTVFRGIVSWNPSQRNFELKVPLNPIISIKEKIPFSIEVRVPGNASSVSPAYLKQVSTGILSGSIDEMDLSKKDVEEVSVTFTSQTLRIIDITSTKLVAEPFEKKMELDLKIQHLGGGDASQITLRLPINSYNIEARDHLGKISSSYDAKTSQVRITFRQALKFGESTYLSIRFKIPENSSIISFEDGAVTINPFLPLNTTSWSYEVQIILRKVEPESWTPEPDEFYRQYPDKSIIVYRFSHIDPINIGEKAINIKVKTLFAVSTTLPYLAIIAIIGIVGSITAVYVKEIKIAPRREKGPVQRLLDEGEFLTPVYQGLTELITSGRIFERGYSRKNLLEIRSNARRHAEKLVRSAKELLKTQPEISKELTDLENAVREFQKAVERAWDITYPYLSGSLSKKKLSERLDKYHDELKRSYNRVIDRLEAVRKRLE